MSFFDLFRKKKSESSNRKQETPISENISLNCMNLCFRKKIEPPTWFESVDLDTIINRRYASDYPSLKKDLEVQKWRPEFGSICVSLLLDKVLSVVNAERGTIYVFTGEKKVEGYIALGTMEMQSSGVRYLGSFIHQGMGVMAVEVDKRLVKPELAIPDDKWAGFGCHSQDNETGSIPVHYLKNDFLNSDVSLTFSVGGEFNLYMLFAKEGESSPWLLFARNFDCK